MSCSLLVGCFWLYLENYPVALHILLATARVMMANGWSLKHLDYALFSGLLLYNVRCYWMQSDWLLSDDTRFGEQLLYAAIELHYSFGLQLVAFRWYTFLFVSIGYYWLLLVTIDYY